MEEQVEESVCCVYDLFFFHLIFFGPDIFFEMNIDLIFNLFVAIFCKLLLEAESGAASVCVCSAGARPELGPAAASLR